MNEGSAYTPMAIADNGRHSVMSCVDEISPCADYSTPSVTECIDGFLLSRSFESAGWMRKGEPQTVGDIWLVFRDGTAEEHLRHTGNWFRKIGMLPPADRPEWVRDIVACYSLHPCGRNDDMRCDPDGLALSRSYLPCLDIPGGVTNRLYKTDYIVMRRIYAKNIVWPMSSPSGEEGRQNDATANTGENPQHYVQLTNDYYIAVFPGTIGHSLALFSNGRVSSAALANWFPTDACAYTHLIGSSSARNGAQPPDSGSPLASLRNVAEWCRDFAGSYEASTDIANPVVAPTGPASNSQNRRRLRGGGFGLPATALRSAKRGSAVQTDSQFPGGGDGHTTSGNLYTAGYRLVIDLDEPVCRESKFPIWNHDYPNVGIQGTLP